MKNLRRYSSGFLIGMLIEYILRQGFYIFPFIILILIILGIIGMEWPQEEREISLMSEIVKVRKGAIDYYYLRVQKKFLWFIVWIHISEVYLNSGSVFQGKSLKTYSACLETLKDYETLFGIKLKLRE